MTAPHPTGRHVSDIFIVAHRRLADVSTRWSAESLQAAWTIEDDSRAYCPQRGKHFDGMSSTRFCQ